MTQGQKHTEALGYKVLYNIDRDAAYDLRQADTPEKIGKLLAERLAAAAPVDTGALAASIKAGSVDYNAADGYHCEVMPVGENHGENLAKIGNILEYGRSNMPARPWFNPTVDQATGEVTQAMQAAFDQAQKG